MRMARPGFGRAAGSPDRELERGFLETGAGRAGEFVAVDGGEGGYAGRVAEWRAEMEAIEEEFRGEVVRTREEREIVRTLGRPVVDQEETGRYTGFWDRDEERVAREKEYRWFH